MFVKIRSLGESYRSLAATGSTLATLVCLTSTTTQILYPFKPGTLEHPQSVAEVLSRTTVR